MHAMGLFAWNKDEDDDETVLMLKADAQHVLRCV